MADRRFFCADPKTGAGRGVPDMAAMLGTSVIVPCASGIDHAMHWEPGKVTLPHRDASRLKDYVSFVLPGKVRLPKNYTPEQLRAAVSSFWDRGADGLYTWFMRWPLDDAQRRMLTEMGDPGLIKEADKHYVLARDVQPWETMHYRTHLPVEIAAADTGTRHPISFYLADDTTAAISTGRWVL